MQIASRKSILTEFSCACLQPEFFEFWLAISILLSCPHGVLPASMLCQKEIPCYTSSAKDKSTQVDSWHVLWMKSATHLLSSSSKRLFQLLQVSTVLAWYKKGWEQKSWVFQAVIMKDSVTKEDTALNGPGEFKKGKDLTSGSLSRWGHLAGSHQKKNKKMLYSENWWTKEKAK